MNHNTFTRPEAFRLPVHCSPSWRRSSSMKSSRRGFLTQKCVQKTVLGVFMVYVVICLHELRNHQLNIQVVMRNEEGSKLEESMSTHPRRTREISVHAHDNNHLTPVDEKDYAQTASSATDAHHADTILDDIHISLKTSKKFHNQRLDVILRTWFNEAKEQTFIITDEDDDEFQRRAGGHMVNSNCTASHNRKALCCKMSAELDVFVSRNKKWFCHVDDDQYLNIRSLLKLLNQYDHNQDWYLGKPSIKAPLEIPHYDSSGSKTERAAFWFATGGAGFCLSRHLVDKMKPIIENGQFMSVGEKIRLPDDVTLGYVIEYMLRTPLTVISKFHSHLEPLQVLSEDDLRDDITFGYSSYKGNQMNRIEVQGWDFATDPTRFYSLHCFLRFKSSQNCPPIKR